MASSFPSLLLSFAVSLFLVLPVALSALPDPPALTYHGGRLLTGYLNISILWYGPVKQVQRRTVMAFLESLNFNGKTDFQPQVSSWWQVVESYQTMTGNPESKKPKIQVRVVNQYNDSNYSVGKVLLPDHFRLLLPNATGGRLDTVVVIVAAKGVTVHYMCDGFSAQHGVIGGQAYVAVGNPEKECPACAWPFVKSADGPHGLTLQPPSEDLGADTMVMLLAGGLAGVVTNPYDDGFYGSGSRKDRIDASTACKGIFGSGAFSGNPGKVRIDPRSGGAFNAHGMGLEKFLLPAIWNPKTSSCWTLL